MFDYNPMTHEEAEKERYSLLNEGEYHATIKAVVPKVSSSNNNMFVLELDVYDDNGRPNAITDYWVFTPKMMWKIIHGCDSAGVLPEYESKQLSVATLINLNVRVKVAIQEGNPIPVDKLNGKPMGSMYPRKNIIDDYVKRENWPANIMPKVGEPTVPFDDDVPF